VLSRLAPPATPESTFRITVADAIKVFLANRAGSNLAPATYRKYVTFTRQLVKANDGGHLEMRA
jgi:hypothetical protein